MFCCPKSQIPQIYAFAPGKVVAPGKVFMNWVAFVIFQETSLSEEIYNKLSFHIGWICFLLAFFASTVLSGFQSMFHCWTGKWGGHEGEIFVFKGKH